MVWRADYKPFGEVQTVTSSISNDKMFAGKEQDKETGLYYFGARYMEEGVGRFTSPDKVGAVDIASGQANGDLLQNPQRINFYAYSLNNPYSFTDPDGNIIWDVMDFGFFAISAYNFANNPSYANGTDLALDTLGLLPLIPSVGSIKFIGKQVTSANDWVELSGMLRDAAKGKRNFGIGSATKEQADAIGKAWVGEGYRISERDPSILLSKDGLKQYRPVKDKIRSGKYQANLERREVNVGEWQHNARIDIVGK